jgi:uncharacterized protein (TIGR04255 family)
LSQVVFEINFPRSFAVENRIAEFQAQVSKVYPNPGDEYVLYIPQGVAFGKPPKSEGHGLTPVRTFVFQNPEASRVVRVSVVQLSLVVSDYLHFEDYKDALMAALEPAIKIFQLSRLERVGLRYVNKISIPEQSGAPRYQDYVRAPIDASAFLPRLLSGFLTEVSVDLDIKKQMSIRHGLLPRQSDRHPRTYLLDLDCSSRESVSLSGLEVANLLDEYHEAIECEFQHAMTDKYWDYMTSGAPL